MQKTCSKSAYSSNKKNIKFTRFIWLRNLVPYSENRKIKPGAVGTFEAFTAVIQVEVFWVVALHGVTTHNTST
jgi:hypothetical protein